MVQTSTCKHWDSGLEIIKDNKCPKLEEAEATSIIIPYDLWMLIMRMTKEVDTEWLGYLQAEILETGDWYVTRLEVPEQEVQAAHVEATETIQAPGVIHSHVNMAASFSSNDDDYINSNHDFSIVVNKKAQVDAVQRVKLPCGCLALVESKVEVEHPEPEESDKFVEEAKKKLTEKKYPVTRKPQKPVYQQGYWDENGQWHDQYESWNWGKQY